MYSAHATRPDITFAVTALYRYNANTPSGHVTVARRVLRYLKATADYLLYYRRSINGCLIYFTGTDWDGDSADRKSQGRYSFSRNGCVSKSWQSRRKDVGATLNYEAEYMACSNASGEARWLIQPRSDMSGNGKGRFNRAPPFIHCYG